MIKAAVPEITSSDRREIERERQFHFVVPDADDRAREGALS